MLGLSIDFDHIFISICLEKVHKNKNNIVKLKNQLVKYFSFNVVFMNSPGDVMYCVKKN